MNPKRGGGLACFIKKGLKHSNTEHEELNISTKDLEMQWISISLHNVRPIVLVNVYRPPQGDYKKCCMDYFFSNQKVSELPWVIYPIGFL